MDRYLETHVTNDLPSKVVLLMGPRQCGKTTMAKQLNPNAAYLNYDSDGDRLTVHEQSWDRHAPLVILDEIHKMKNWKRWLKGVYDTEGIPPELIVTGSARLDMMRNVGDSLAGRYFSYRLHPVDVREAVDLHGMSPDEAFDTLWTCSGFPEPFFKQSGAYYDRWRKTHIDVILHQDFLDLYSIYDIQRIKRLIDLLRARVGASVSYANLARDLEVDSKTIKRWLQLLENLFIIFRVTPYASNIARSLRKEPKFYFYDTCYAADSGARLENVVACALLKWLHFLEDTSGKTVALHYLRTRDGKELDFLVCLDNVPTHMIEVKSSDDSPCKHFQYFDKHLPGVKKLQLVKTLSREKMYPDGLEMRALINWLARGTLL